MPPLFLFIRPSFERSVKRMGSQQMIIVGRIMDVLEVYYASGCNLEEAKKMAPRFFYKQLMGPYYEAGIEVNVRVVIRRDGEKCVTLLAGNHDQVKRFLRSVM